MGGCKHLLIAEAAKNVKQAQIVAGVRAGRLATGGPVEFFALLIRGRVVQHLESEPEQGLRPRLRREPDVKLSEFTLTGTFLHKLASSKYCVCSTKFLFRAPQDRPSASLPIATRCAL